MDLLNAVYLDNSVRAWLVALALALASFTLVRIVTGGLIRRLRPAAERSRNYWDDVLVAALQATHPLPLLAFAVWIGSTVLTLPDAATRLLEIAAIIALLVQAGLWASAGLTRWIQARAEAQVEDDPSAVMTMNVLGIAARIALWSMVLLLALDNLGVDVTALVAGLGIGGVAVALALQNVLGDLFASLSIVLDKPFVLGDFLVIGDFLGTVEAIGLKTTRVRSLSGEQVVFSNADLLGSRIRNYGRMYERRVVFKVGVTYQTPHQALKEIPELIREIVEGADEELVRFDRSHMSSYGDYAIVFETVYYVASPEFNLHMDIQQSIFLGIHRAFEERGIEFAYPTQTIFLERAEA